MLNCFADDLAQRTGDFERYSAPSANSKQSASVLSVEFEQVQRNARGGGGDMQ